MKEIWEELVCRDIPGARVAYYHHMCLVRVSFVLVLNSLFWLCIYFVVSPFTFLVVARVLLKSLLVKGAG